MRMMIKMIRVGMVAALLGFLLAGCTTTQWDLANRQGRSWSDEVARSPGSHFTDQWGHAGVHPWDP